MRTTGYVTGQRAVPTKKQLGERLRRLREAAGYDNRPVFAESIGLKPKTYNNYEYGTANPPYDVLWAIADKLGLTLDELMGRGAAGDREVYARLRARNLESRSPVEVAIRAASPSASDREVLEGIYALAKRAVG